MADKKISALSSASTPLAGTEVLPIVQSSSTVKVSVANLTAGRDVATKQISSTVSGATTALDGWNLSNGTATGIFKVSGATYAYRGVGSNYLWIGGDGTPMYIGTSTAQPVRMGTNAFQNFTLETDGNMSVNNAGNGFKFNANTPAAGMTSQLLNWYEEGTWTPNQGAGLTLVGAFSSAGTYTRIGRQVFIRGSVSGATSVAVASAGAITTNLPYSAAADATGTAIDAANNASSILRVSSATLTAATAIAATTTITFSAVYSV